MALSDNLRGALLMMGSMAAFTVNDTFMKTLAGEAPLFQLLFLRGILASLLIGALAWRAGALRASVPRRDRGLIFGRILSEIGAAYFFSLNAAIMPVACSSRICTISRDRVAAAATTGGTGAVRACWAAGRAQGRAFAGLLELSQRD